MRSSNEMKTFHICNSRIISQYNAAEFIKSTNCDFNHNPDAVSDRWSSTSWYDWIYDVKFDSRGDFPCKTSLQWEQI